MTGPGAGAPACVLGVDGGGSKTACRLATVAGETLGEGAAGPANYQSVGEVGALAALTAAVAGAAGGRTAMPVPVVGLCLALAGVDRPADREALLRVATRLLATPVPGITWRVPAERVAVVNDAVAALVGGTGRLSGIVCAAGTGSIAFGMRGEGRRARAGGWGYLLGDEGSGYAIGLATLRAVCRAADGRGPATALTALVLDHLGLADPSGLIGLAYGGWGPADVARLAPLAGAAAGGRDAVAGAILDEAATELSLATAAVARDLQCEGDAAFGLEVVTGGGLWTGLPGLRERFATLVAGRLPGAAVIAPREQPVGGAVLLARRAAGAVTLE